MVSPQRLAIAQESRAREHIDLRARVVDVVFARDVMAGEREQICQGIAKHRAAPMADMHGPGRVGGNIFDVDRARSARCRCARIPSRAARHRAAILIQAYGLSVRLMKPGPATSHFGHRRVGREAVPHRLQRDRAACLPDILREHHGALVAISPWRLIARRLDLNARDKSTRPATDRRATSSSRPRRMRSSISAKMLIARSDIHSAPFEPERRAPNAIPGSSQRAGHARPARSGRSCRR